MTRFVYPTLLTADEKDGGFVVIFRDLPEAITQGNSFNIHEKEVRRILAPHHATKLSTIERTLAALGQRIELQITAK
ncbi:type II toxin-antitoxin system HicB family antitoxin [Dolichospermum flos-aquae]|uniref:Type II toxin-antitoxin system HicB family antitoxin n=1 Tax=Dolichospermum flos-aquae LEGE 04289 TaxID=1828708 RepID=A0ACC5PZ78_DOLFA|nr:type II toxin-antitoxin system HicB family antitoxin [Dolichospermum flos-aquae]MBE9218139.1 type II toxin-antitoxin system HicB family antitoxin [Dolichospermum flos-aquae LEGE 04289]